MIHSWSAGSSQQSSRGVSGSEWSEVGKWDALTSKLEVLDWSVGITALMQVIDSHKVAWEK